MPHLMPPPPSTGYFKGVAWSMYGEALWQWQEKHYAAAILLSQVAVEMGARNAFTSLLVRRDGHVDDAIMKRCVPGFSFIEEDTRRLWTSLTGDSVTCAPKDVWKAYDAHVVRRNRIAHGLAWGDANGGRDAFDSWSAAGAFIGRLDATMKRGDAGSPP